MSDAEADRHHANGVRPKLRLGSIAVDNVSFVEAAERVMALAAHGRANGGGPGYIVTPNADHLVRLEADAAFREVYAGADLVVADGMPLVWASRLIGPRLVERVTGADLMPHLCALAAQRGVPVFILGGPPGVGEICAAVLQRLHPTLRIAGFYSPPFGFEKDAAENARIVAMLNASGARIVFVGVGAPKQELWIHRHRTQLSCGVLLGIGAAIEFIAGTVPRAPRIFQTTGMEWAYRLVQDPKRLAKRYWQDLEFFRIAYRSWRERR